jgi:uncharacterized membrane protein YheB (UPF0754 family)
VRRYAGRHWSSPSSAADDAPARLPPANARYARWLPVLRAVPWALGLLFAASFAWDFPGYTVTVGGYALAFDGLLRIVSVSGLIGFLTNWLAVTMLFRPRRPRPLLGQGLVPAQRDRIAHRLATAVSEELVSEAIIKEKIRESGLVERYRSHLLATTRDVLEDPSFRRRLRVLAVEAAEEALASEAVQERLVQLIVRQIEAQAQGGLSGLALRAYRSLNEGGFRARLREAVRALPQSLDPVLDEADAALDRLPDQLEEHADQLEAWATRLVLRFVEQLDVERIVRDNLAAYDERQLEDLLKRTTNEQLNYIKYLGGVLGTFGGLVIWNPPVALGTLGTASLLVLGLDVALASRSDNL